MNRNKNPRLEDPQVLQSLANSVAPGTYHVYSASEALPSGLSWPGTDFSYVVLAASSYDGTPITGLNPSITPSGYICLERTFRASTGGSMPHKVDDHLYFMDASGRAWSIHSKGAPDHHWTIMSGSGLKALVDDYHLPSAASGTLDEYRSGSGDLDFEQPFWKARP